MSDYITDYFEPEVLIVEKLRQVMPELQAIYTPGDMIDVKESSLQTPCAHVIYRGDRVVVDSVGNGERATVFQQWVVVLAARHAAAQLSNTTEVRKIVGPLIPKLLAGMQGFQPVTWMKPLRRVGGNPVVGSTPAFAYFPYLFEGRINT